SKANRLRGFWQVADDKVAAKSIIHMLKYIDTQIAIGRLNAGDFSTDLIQRAKAISAGLSGTTPAGPADNSTQETDLAKTVNSAGREALAHLRDKLAQMGAMAPQERGFAFEKFLNELFNLFQL